MVSVSIKCRPPPPYALLRGNSVHYYPFSIKSNSKQASMDKRLLVDDWNSQFTTYNHSSFMYWTESTIYIFLLADVLYFKKTGITERVEKGLLWLKWKVNKKLGLNTTQNGLDVRCFIWSVITYFSDVKKNGQASRTSKTVNWKTKWATLTKAGADPRAVSNDRQRNFRSFIFVESNTMLTFSNSPNIERSWFRHKFALTWYQRWSPLP